MIKNADKIVLTCHVRPDGDAIGSTLGLYHLFVNMGKQPQIITPDFFPKTLSFLPGHKEITAYSRYPEFCQKLIDESSLIICCDFNTLHRIDKLQPLIEKSKAQKILIDHHQNPDNFCNLTFSHPEMSSTCELVFRLIAASGLIDFINKKVATSIATGLITDTRNLSVNCDNREIYLIMYHLLEYGIDKQTILRQTMELKTLDCIKLQSFAISEKMKIYPKHHAAIISLTNEELNRYNYEKGDTEGLVNQPLQIPEIIYSIFLREDQDCIKVSCRSIDKFPVSKICEEHFGGGGHLQAAGGEYNGTIQECIKLLEKIMPEYDNILPI